MSDELSLPVPPPGVELLWSDQPVQIIDLVVIPCPPNTPATPRPDRPGVPFVPIQQIPEEENPAPKDS
jgi:hypothetical protein